MTAPAPVSMLGVVGGLGPIASAEFLRTIYEYSAGEAEQAMPAVILWSDPTVPDRTEALLTGANAVLLERLKTLVGQLVALRCSQIVICCVTVHALIPQLSPDLQRRITSLVDVAIEQIRARGERQLLFCSSGTRVMRLFEQHPGWRHVEQLVVLPGRADQAAIHELIYAIKQTGNARRHLHAAGELLAKYGVESMTVGCTEFHLLAKAARRRALAWRTCDPLDWIARQWSRPGLGGARIADAAAAVNGSDAAQRARPITLREGSA